MGEAKARGMLEERAAQAEQQAEDGQIAVKILCQQIGPIADQKPDGPKFTLSTQTQSVAKSNRLKVNGERVVETKTWLTGLPDDTPESVKAATERIMTRALASGMIALGLIDPLDLAVQFLISQGMVQIGKEPAKKLAVPGEKQLMLPAHLEHLRKL